MKNNDVENDGFKKRLAILGGGNIGQAIARGLAVSGRYPPENIVVTRRQLQFLKPLSREGFAVQKDNRDAVRRSRIVVLSVLPQQLVQVLDEIAPVLKAGRHIVISVVTGVSIGEMAEHLRKDVSLIRAMPNLAIAIRESMTCLATTNAPERDLEEAVAVFEAVGTAIVVNEEDMIPATALCACGIAFFLRSIRAASQGGIEIGFHSDDALIMAAQTAKGAAALLLKDVKSHPEAEIDKVTTPRGCTIAGLNEMEHMGFSSAMIKGITTAAEKAAGLFRKK